VIGWQKKRANGNKKNRESSLQLGDRNTSFFYSALKKRQATNHTTQRIKEDGEAASNIASIKSFAPTYYADLFSQSSY